MTPSMRREVIAYVERQIADAKDRLDVPAAATRTPDEVATDTLETLRANAELVVLGELHRALVTDTVAPPPKSEPPAWFRAALTSAMQRDGMAKVERESGSKTLPWVLRFAAQMEKKLAANRHKGDREGWQKDPVEELLERLRQEVDKLAKALEHDVSSASVEAVTGEAADVANFAMMIADVVGGLEP